jgi:hypothetical protein
MIAHLKAEQARRQRAAQSRLDTLTRLDEIRANCLKFAGFIREAWTQLEPTARYKPNWHHDAIGEHLEAVSRGEIKRLIVNQPPGTMKSLTVSVLFQCWEWGPMNCPGLRYLTTSYREDWARRDSRKSRDLIQSEWYQTLWPYIRLTRDGETDFENTFLGNRKAVPFKSLTAGRGNRVVVDDPHSTEQAESDADREVATRVFRESVTSRLNDPERDCILICMHRLHPDDVCGVVERLGLPYVKLILPMEYVRSLSVKTPWFTDPRTIDGDLLCPNRIDRETVEQNKIELGDHAYQTQYQQQAMAREGAFYFNPEHFLVKVSNGADQWLPAPRPELCDSVFCVIDTASKVGKARDGTGVSYYAYTKYPEEQLRILDWDLLQMNAAVLEHWLPNVLERCEELSELCGARMGSLGAWIEEKDSGIVLLQQAENRGLLAQAIQTKLTQIGKDGRALSVSGYIYKGMVKICQEAYDKQSSYHGRMRNHFWWQATTFRIGYGTPTDEDEMFDTLCYGVAISLGNIDAF